MLRKERCHSYIILSTFSTAGMTIKCRLPITFLSLAPSWGLTLTSCPPCFALSFSQVSLFLPSLNRKQSPLSFSISLNNSSYSISQQCLTALGQVAANADASSCLNIPAFVQILNTPAASSIVQPYNTWLSGLCGRPICSDATLTSIASTVGPACPTELQALGFTPNNFATEFKAFYPVFRKIICLKQSVSCRFLFFFKCNWRRSTWITI